MIDRHILPLIPSNRERALRGVAAAIARGGMVMELRDARRTDDQNAALHGLIAQIIRQRPTHNGVKMNMALWKATFMQALGEEVRFIPTLEGDGLFPLGLSTSALGKARFAELIELILAWCAREGLTVKHFDEAPRDGETANNGSPVAA